MNNFTTNLLKLTDRFKNVSEFCEQVGIERTKYYRLVSGKNEPKLTDLKNISEKCNITIDILVNGEV